MHESIRMLVRYMFIEGLLCSPFIEYVDFMGINGIDYLEQVFQYRLEHTELKFMQQIYHQIGEQLETQRQ